MIIFAKRKVKRYNSAVLNRTIEKYGRGWTTKQIRHCLRTAETIVQAETAQLKIQQIDDNKQDTIVPTLSALLESDDNLPQRSITTKFERIF